MPSVDAPPSSPNSSESRAPQRQPYSRLDRWAIGLSVLCVVHCLAIPVTLLLVPLFASELISHQSFVHWLLLVLALPLSAIALWAGYRRHSAPVVLITGCLGLLSMFIGVAHLAGVQLELPLSVFGAICLIYAHLENLRRGHR